MPTGFQNVSNKTTSTGRKSNLIPCFPPLVSQSSECRVPIILHDLILFNCEVERRKKNHKNAVHPLKTEREKERKKVQGEKPSLINNNYYSFMRGVTGQKGKTLWRTIQAQIGIAKFKYTGAVQNCVEFSISNNQISLWNGVFLRIRQQ